MSKITENLQGRVPESELVDEIDRLKYLLVKEYLDHHDPNSLAFFLDSNDIEVTEDIMKRVNQP